VSAVAPTKSGFKETQYFNPTSCHVGIYYKYQPGYSLATNSSQHDWQLEALLLLPLLILLVEVVKYQHTE